MPYCKQLIFFILFCSCTSVKRLSITANVLSAEKVICLDSIQGTKYIVALDIYNKGRRKFAFWHLSLSPLADNLMIDSGAFCCTEGGLVGKRKCVVNRNEKATFILDGIFKPDEVHSNSLKLTLFLYNKKEIDLINNKYYTHVDSKMVLAVMKKARKIKVALRLDKLKR